MGLGPTMLIRMAVFAMLSVLSVGGCGSQESPGVAVPEEAIDHPFYFDVSILNVVGGFQMSGTFIDSRGHTVAYDHSFGPWRIASPSSVTVAEMEDRFSVPTDTLGVVDAATLAGMYAKVAAAGRGTISAPLYTGDGPGTIIYCCHAYDEEIGGYVKVLFKQTGDFTSTNSSPEAQELVVWLDSVLQGSSPDFRLSDGVLNRDATRFLTSLPQ